MADIYRLRAWPHPGDDATLRVPAESLQQAAIVFLDIDDVLNFKGCTGYFVDLERVRGRWTGIMPELVERLNRVHETLPNVRYVLSSTWREDYTPTLHYLRRQGFRGKFVGMTAPTTGYRYRDREILGWIAEHSFKGPWVALDDDERIVNLPSFVQTNPDVGVTDADIDELIEKLCPTPSPKPA